MKTRSKFWRTPAAFKMRSFYSQPKMMAVTFDPRPAHWGGAAPSAASTVLMMTICSRLVAGDAGGLSCSTRACSVSELMVCSWSGSKVTGSAVLSGRWEGSGLNSCMTEVSVAVGSAVAADGARALGSGVVGCGFSGSSSGMETKVLFSWEILFWMKVTGWLEARRITAEEHRGQKGHRKS